MPLKVTKLDPCIRPFLQIRSQNWAYNLIKLSSISSCHLLVQFHIEDVRYAMFVGTYVC